jgi:hypothetical protein
LLFNLFDLLLLRDFLLIVWCLLLIEAYVLKITVVGDFLSFARFYLVFACVKNVALTLGLIKIFKIVPIVCVLDCRNVIEQVGVLFKVLVAALFRLLNSRGSLRLFGLFNWI